MSSNNGVMSEHKKVGASVKAKQVVLYDMCHQYLIDNFHKFSEANKIKVSLTLASKMVPQEKSVDIDGQIKVTMMPTIKTETGQEVEFNIGSPADTSAPRWAGQVTSGN